MWGAMGTPAATLREHATIALEPIGLQPRGRSGRVWIADRGWWLLNLEIQPSNRQRGVAYINIGEQHLWTPQDHLVFEEMERPLGGTTTVDLGGGVRAPGAGCSASVRARDR